jgi:hypothetical protein
MRAGKSQEVSPLEKLFERQNTKNKSLLSYIVGLSTLK